ncbi:hypothetical protein TNIN_381611 [Trichonephila inaurata madagascariensis]|uniref:Uncharacterized protein n=1 Tax=Trichonephila inaurata madagascariensis TaxID=2747483 RepID=A0A8X7C819_9ARAC|nr:hypothetical protein TNIN_381611 [Trichonephila inaurata madagascariensis]
MKTQAGRPPVLLARWIVRGAFGGDGQRRNPRTETGSERPGNPREEGSKDRAASTCGPHSDCSTSSRRRGNCSTNFRHLAEQILNPQAPLFLTPFNTGKIQLRLSGVKSVQCGMSQISKKGFV